MFRVSGRRWIAPRRVWFGRVVNNQVWKMVCWIIFVSMWQTRYHFFLFFINQRVLYLYFVNTFVSCSGNKNLIYMFYTIRLHKSKSWEHTMNISKKNLNIDDTHELISVGCITVVIATRCLNSVISNMRSLWNSRKDVQNEGQVVREIDE